MILALMVVYIVILHLVFNVFKWVTPTTRNRIYVTVAGLFGIYCILLVINIFQPMSTDLRVFRIVTPVSSVVSGQVAEVPVDANKPLEKGDVLFQIDPVPYQAAADQLEAQLQLARLRLEDSRKLLAQKAISSYEVDAFDAQVRQLEAALRAARFNLEHTTVRAPSNGRVSDIALQPGQVVGSGMPVMSFVNTESYFVAATFRQEVIKRIKPGDAAEVAFDTLPGRTITARVSHVDRDIPQGQVVPSGRVFDTSRVPHGFVFVHFNLEDDEGLDFSAGEAGAATIYTDSGQSWIAVRKVFFRWYTWMNFIITEMDIRGKRMM